jgi:hypothetical protein
MKWSFGLLFISVLTSSALAQTPGKETQAPANPAPTTWETVGDHLGGDTWSVFPRSGAPDCPDSILTGNTQFNNFIGYVSNPLFAIDPRAVTELYPIFDCAWTSAFPALPSGNVQIYGAGLTVALSERFSFGLNQGGYVVSQFTHSNNPPPLSPLLGTPNTSGGARDGWLNLGGFFQYTLIEDVPDQFLLTAGLRWEAPTGSADVFQGHGPAHLAPYVTIGKEFEDFHILATTGYAFPVRSDDLNASLFYGTVHLDRRCGWFYPLIEFNWAYHTTAVDFTLPNLPGIFSFGPFAGTGNILTMAVGADVVIIPNKLELAGVYETSLAAQNDFSFNGLLLKMVMRY